MPRRKKTAYERIALFENWMRNQATDFAVTKKA